MTEQSTVYVVDDDAEVRVSLSKLLQSKGLQVRCFSHGPAFLKACPPNAPGCLILDVRMPGPSGLDLQQCLHEQGYSMPVLVVTGHGDVPMAVRALKAGALDFIEKPFVPSVLIQRVHDALALDVQRRQRQREDAMLRARLALLTNREREILQHVVHGRYNKVIAAELKISISTVEAHRKKIMEKLRANSLYELIRIVESNPDDSRS